LATFSIWSSGGVVIGDGKEGPASARRSLSDASFL